MEEISCIFCRMPSYRVAITEHGFTGVKCNRCNLIYISPRPTAAETTHLYTDEHAALYADAQFQFDAFNRMEAARTLSKISDYRKNGSILELGAGGGCLLEEARRRGYQPYGIELNPIEARWINEYLQIPCEREPLSEASFGRKHFDIVYHRDLLSHLSDPITVFRDINRSLKEDGLLVFETGNIADVDEKYMKYFSQFSYPDHLFFFGEKSLNTLLEQTGFKCIHIFREAIFLQLLLQKALWGIKDSLKDKKVIGDMKLQKDLHPEGGGLSVKRRLRLFYRYVGHYLVRFGAILPKNRRPLKLVVVARKVGSDH
jgi:2-polyprenyl-3-methyl-5-hydroxy-6-metoxy-1,4-benzoquinol methylase